MNNLQSLIADGTCICYIDYRSGLTRDWSENGNNASATDASFFQRQYMSIADSDDFDFRNGGSVIVFGKFQQQDAANIIFAVKGANEWYFGSYDDDISVYDGTIYSGYSFGEYKNFECAGASFGNGSRASIYIDGAFVSLGGGTTNNITDSTGNVICGHSGYGSRNYVLDAAVFFNRQLTAEEHAAVYQELKAMTWPTKQYSQVPAKLYPLPSSCVCAIDGQWSQNKFANRAYPLKPGTLKNTFTTTSENVISNMLLGNATNHCEVDFYSSVQLTGRPLTLSCWYKQNATNTKQLWGQSFASYRFIVVNGRVDVRFKSNDKILECADDSIDGVWSHYTATWDNDGNIIWYRDGLPDGVTDTYTGSWSTTASDLRIGHELNSPTGMLDGQVVRARVYNQALTADEVLAEYQEGAQAIQFKTEWGWLEKSSSGVGDFVGPFEVRSGTHKITTDIIQGQLCKVLECTSNGDIVIDLHQYINANEILYGTWDLWFYKGTVGNTWMTWGDQKTPYITAGQDGYILNWLDTLNNLRLRFVTNGNSGTIISTPNDYITNEIWYNYKWTRNNPGDCTLFVNGTLIGTATNTAHNYARYLYVEMTRGDKLAIASPQGQYAITKRLGVY